MIAAIAIALAAAAAWYVLAPLRRAATIATAEVSDERNRLIRERETALRALRDLAFDHATGKMSDADYEALRIRQEAAALEALHRLDAIEVASDRGRAPAPARPIGE